jgi:hypothetical protein
MTPPSSVIASSPALFWAAKQSIFQCSLSLGGDLCRSNLFTGTPKDRLRRFAYSCPEKRWAATKKLSLRLLRSPEEHRRLAMTVSSRKKCAQCGGFTRNDKRVGQIATLSSLFHRDLSLRGDLCRSNLFTGIPKDRLRRFAYSCPEKRWAATKKLSLRLLRSPEEHRRLAMTVSSRKKCAQCGGFTRNDKRVG